MRKQSATEVKEEGLKLRFELFKMGFKHYMTPLHEFDKTLEPSKVYNLLNGLSGNEEYLRRVSAIVEQLKNE